MSIISPIIFSLAIGYFVSVKKTDFCQDYKSASLIVNSKSPYIQIKCWNFPPPFNNEINPHPPFSILIYIPLLAFDMKTASFLWSILSTLFYFYALYLLSKSLNKNTLNVFAISAVFNLLWLPFYYLVS